MAHNCNLRQPMHPLSAKKNKTKNFQCERQKNLASWLEGPLNFMFYWKKIFFTKVRDKLLNKKYLD